MKFLLDTQLLIWAAAGSRRLPPRTQKLVADPRNDLLFSAASIWEIAIKRGLRRPDFTLEPRLFRRNLLDNGYTELPVTSQHAAGVDDLPDIHKDPFDRLLIAQAINDGITFLTSDARLARYPGPVRKV